MLYTYRYFLAKERSFEDQKNIFENEVKALGEIWPLKIFTLVLQLLIQRGPLWKILRFCHNSRAQRQRCS